MRELATPLRERRQEIEQAMLARFRAVSDPTEVDDPEYVLGLKEAVGVGVDHALGALEKSRGGEDPIPPVILAQPRAAARNGVSLETVLRRCSAAYTLLTDFLIEEAENGNVPPKVLKQALRTQAAVYDRLVVAVAAEHACEARSGLRSSGQRRADLVRMLLAGDPIDSGELRYPLEAWHLALIAFGPGVEHLARELASALDRQALIVAAGEETVWAWLAGQREIDPREVVERVAEDRLGEYAVAVGEPGWHLSGWRFSHRQAKAAMPIARRRMGQAVRYGEVSLLASMLQDEVLTKSLRDLYLAPLTEQRDGGRVLRQTLSAYFARERNVSSTAATLRVSRKTVTKRLRQAEEQLGRPLSLCAAELEAALRLEQEESIQPA